MKKQTFLKKIFYFSRINNDATVFGDGNFHPEYYLNELNPKNNPKLAMRLSLLLEKCIASEYLSLEMTGMGLRLHLTGFGYNYIGKNFELFKNAIIQTLVGSFTTVLGVFLGLFISSL